MCISFQNIAETHFVQTTDIRNKRLLFGVIYRHPNTDIDIFSTEVLTKLTSTVINEKRECIIMGDFNINLLNYQSDAATADFFNTFSSALCQPLILQPTRITRTSQTLINNIFINKLEYKCTSGNINTSISNHFPQFTHIQRLTEFTNLKNKTIWKRDYRNFNNQEFLEELGKIDWVATLAGSNAEEAFNIFYSIVDKILNVMAPVKLLNRKEIGILVKPWLTKCTLKSIDTRDKLHKSFITDIKNYLHKQYKSYRNLLITLQRVSKKVITLNISESMLRMLGKHGRASKKL